MTRSTVQPCDAGSPPVTGRCRSHVGVVVEVAAGVEPEVRLHQDEPATGREHPACLGEQPARLSPVEVFEQVGGEHHVELAVRRTRSRSVQSPTTACDVRQRPPLDHRVDDPSPPPAPPGHGWRSRTNRRPSSSTAESDGMYRSRYRHTCTQTWVRFEFGASRVWKYPDAAGAAAGSPPARLRPGHRPTPGGRYKSKPPTRTTSYEFSGRRSCFGGEPVS